MISNNFNLKSVTLPITNIFKSESFTFSKSKQLKARGLAILTILLSTTSANADQLFCSVTEKIAVEYSFHFAQDIPEYDRVRNPLPSAFLQIPEGKSTLINGFIHLNGKRILANLIDKKNGGSFSMSGASSEPFMFQWSLPNGTWIKGECEVLKNGAMM